MSANPLGGSEMALDLTETELFDFIIGDFEAAWQAMTSDPRPGHRGNFMFARQAVTLLEVAARLCKSDNTGQALRDFGAELQRREPRYFTRLPASCWSPAQRTRQAFELPSHGPDPDNQLMAALFNLVRDGQAHQYQQMRAVMSDGRSLRISLTGAETGLSLEACLAAGRPAQHLSLSVDSGDLWITVRTEILFIDLRDAVAASRLLHRGLRLSFMAEDRPATFNVSAAEAETALRQAGH
jgi:hypothetical protein